MHITEEMIAKIYINSEHMGMGTTTHISAAITYCACCAYKNNKSKYFCPYVLVLPIVLDTGLYQNRDFCMTMAAVLCSIRV